MQPTPHFVAYVYIMYFFLPFVLGPMRSNCNWPSVFDDAELNALATEMKLMTDFRALVFIFAIAFSRTEHTCQTVRSTSGKVVDVNMLKGLESPQRKESEAKKETSC